MKSRYRIVSALVFIGGATALFMWVRLYLVEPETLAAACISNMQGWRCNIRQAAVMGFLHQVYGWTALLTGLFATILRWRWLALVAMLFGVAGAVLYTFELSGFGLILGALVWVHCSMLTQPKRGDEQHA
jgi:hypothetical protein